MDSGKALAGTKSTTSSIDDLLIQKCENVLTLNADHHSPEVFNLLVGNGGFSMVDVRGVILKGHLGQSLNATNAKIEFKVSSSITAMRRLTLLHS